MPAPENTDLYTMRLSTPQLNRIAQSLRDPNRSRIVRKALDALEAQMKGEPFTVSPAPAFSLPPKRTLKTGRVQVTVRVDEELLERLKGMLNMSNTQVIEAAIELLYAREVDARLPKLNQEESL